MAKLVYKYGMLLRGYSFDAQPMTGLIEHDDDPLGDYVEILVYDHPLTNAELQQFDLEYIGARRQL